MGSRRPRGSRSPGNDILGLWLYQSDMGPGVASRDYMKRLPIPRLKRRRYRGHIAWGVRGMT